MTRNNREPLLYGLFFISGATGLVYELAWTRLFVLVFGGTTYAIATVLVAYMAGLGLGCYLAGRLVAGLKRPVLWYGVLETAIGLWALLLPSLLDQMPSVLRAVGSASDGSFALLTLSRLLLGVALLLVPTTCMGATLPLLLGHVAREDNRIGAAVGRLYGINTLGAAAGTLAAGFWLLPSLGVSATTHLAAAANLLIALVAVYVFGRCDLPDVAEDAASTDKRSLCATEHRRLILVVAMASGLASMVYQIAWTRVLVMSVGSSTYAFTCILAAFILGLALGSLLAARWVDRTSQLLQQLGMVQLGIAMVAVFLGPVYGRLPNVIGSLVSGSDMGFSRILQLEFVLIVAVTIIPTALMGMVFPMAIRALASTSKQAGAATGAVYAANTIGAVTGSLLGGFILIRSDVLGLQNSILAAAAVNLAAAMGLFWAARRSGHFRLVVYACGMVILFLTITSVFRWDHMILTSAPYLGDDFTRKRDRQIEYYGEGIDATISIERIKGAEDYVGLVVNGKVDASTGLFDMTTQLLLGHLPALLTEDGHKACVIGLGSGVTLGAVAQHPSFEQIDCVEISDESILAAGFFAQYNHDILNDERANIISADGRNYLLLTDHTYDLIISEPSNLWITGMANLFTREFFAICRDRLNDRGRMCVWLHGYSMSPDDFKMVIRTLYDVFEFVSLWESLDGDYILIASDEPFELSARKLQARFEIPAVRKDLYRIGHGQLHHVLGTFIACGKDLRDWAGSGPLHTDDRTQLEFSAPYDLHSQGSDSPVSRELLNCQSDLSPEIIDLSDAVKSQQILREKIDGIALARRHRIAAKEAWLKNDLPGCLNLLLKAYQHYPGDIRAFRRLEQFRTKIEKQLQTAGPSKSSGLLAVLKKLNRLERPTISEHSPRVAYRLHDMSVQLHKAADEAMKHNRWDAAARHLIELDGIEKLSQDQWVMLIFALLNSRQTDAGRVRLDQMLVEHPDFGQAHYLRAQVALQQNDTAKAIQHLEKALKTGFVTPDYLQKSHLFKELLNNAEFQKKFKTHGDQDE